MDKGQIIDELFQSNFYLDELRMFYDAIDHEKEGQTWWAEDSGKAFADGSPVYIVKSNKGIVSYPQSLEVAVFISCAHNNWEIILDRLDKEKSSVASNGETIENTGTE